VVTLRFAVAADGRVLGVTLISGSGFSVLDEAAEMLLRSARLPAPQVELARTIRLRYRLEN
jgi:TonB family protein